MPGVRLNFGKETVGLSFGVPGMRYTINSKGRRTLTTGLPGTGLYNVETLSSGTRASGRSSNTSAEQYSGSTAPAPGFFASKSERAFSKLFLEIYGKGSRPEATYVIEKCAALSKQYDDLKYPLDLIAFLHGIADVEWAPKAQSWGAVLWEHRELAFSDKLVIKYFTEILPKVTISPGITTRLHYNRQTFSFIWAEVLQGQEKFDEALSVLHLMQPDQMVAVSIADIEITQRNFDGAIETTDDIEVFDDATAMLMLLRGIAFREKGMNDAAIECFKRTLKETSLPEALQHRTLFERAVTYALMGKRAMGIKDLELILVDDPNYPEVEKKLTELKK